MTSRSTYRNYKNFLGLLVLGVGFALPFTADAQILANIIDLGAYVSLAVAWVLQLIIQAVGMVISWAVGYLIVVSKYNNFIYSPVVLQGWNVIRDISNMFFVLTLLIISFGTILHIEQYQLKRLLPKVILMAILVNFSKAICGLLIDFSQVIMLTFVAAYSAAGPGNFLSSLSLPGIQNLKVSSDAFQATTAGQVTASSVAATYIAIVFMAVVSLFVVLSFLIILVIRMVTLWLLIIFSPMVYVLSILPFGQKYSSQWWDAFTKQLILGPVLAFFLWLSLATLPTIVSGTLAPTTATTGIGAGQTLPSIGLTEAGSPGQVAGFVISTCMLLASLVFAQQVGGAAGKIASSAYSKVISGGAKAALLPFKALKQLPGYINERVAGETGVTFNPLDWQKAWSEARAYKKTQRLEGAQGFARDVAQFGFVRFGITKTRRALGDRGQGAKKRLKKAEHEKAKLVEENRQATGLDVIEQRDLHLHDANQLRERIKEQQEVVKVESTPISAQYAKVKEARAKAENDRKEAEKERDKHKAGTDEYNAFDRRAADAIDKRDTIDNIGGLKASEVLHATAQRLEGEAQKKMQVVFAEKDPQKQAVLLLQAREVEDQARIARQQALASEVGVINKSTLPEVQAEQSAVGAVFNRIQEITTGVNDDAIKARVQEKLATGTDPELRASYTARAQKEKASAKAELHLIDKSLSSQEADRKLTKTNALLTDIDALIKKLNNEGNTAQAAVETAKRNKIQKEADDIKLYKKALADGKLDTHLGVEGSASRERILNTVRRGSPENKEIELNHEELEHLEHELESTEEAAEIKATAKRGVTSEDVEKNKKRLKALQGEMNDAQQEISARALPGVFYQEQSRRHLVGEELKKLQTANYEELIEYFKQAQREGDQFKAQAVLHKLASDSNENEILNDMGYSSNFDGYKQFFEKEIIGTGLMHREEALALATDVSATNESRNHWDTARTVSYDKRTNEFRWKTEKEHVNEALAEIRKINPRKVAQDFNRLAYGGETSNASGRKFELGPLGMGVLQLISKQMEGFIGRNEMNKNAAYNLSQALGQIQNLPANLRSTSAKLGNYSGSLTLDDAYNQSRSYLEQD